jgi:integrase
VCAIGRTGPLSAGCLCSFIAPKNRADDPLLDQALHPPPLKRYPLALGKLEVEVFLSRLASAGEVAASTQNQVLAALLFLHKEILDIRLPWLDELVRAKRPKKLPLVLTRGEVQRLLASADSEAGLFMHLLNGTGIRIMECATLRIKDIGFRARLIWTTHEGHVASTRVLLGLCQVKSFITRCIGSIRRESHC